MESNQVFWANPRFLRTFSDLQTLMLKPLIWVQGGRSGANHYTWSDRINPYFKDHPG